MVVIDDFPNGNRILIPLFKINILKSQLEITYFLSVSFDAMFLCEYRAILVQNYDSSELSKLY